MEMGKLDIRKMIFAENGNWRKFKVENKKKGENGKLGEREIRQMGNHDEGIQGKWILGKRVICKNTKWKKRNQQEWKLGKKEIGKKFWEKRKLGKLKFRKLE